MALWFAWFVALAAVAVAGYAAFLLVRDRPVDNPLFYAAAALEVLVVVQTVAGCVALANTGRDVEGVTFVGYLLTCVLIPPAAVIWGVAEKTRWGTGVVVVGMLTVAVLVARLVQIWNGHA
ncbi:hypothetical protein KV102_01925 [Mumia sp. zg.B53]|uniref:hypothetical protein n=2 Tax=Mumia TaxID=1546255 RepID=UPI001C6DE797|nr:MULTISPECIES: hypothetical protein [unclassified Mumia]MBW9205018.1 hypothetical protein [Mumia sp. zg.B17]MBW9208977.1 hypothetical protein [Mumia sp. zg.B21]MBW9213588.1 hypothetical protein [Mumia sp. zg.B53]